ncbi:MAG: hypothetical protein R3C61_28915 [Bacteroidia bacterium]
MPYCIGHNKSILAYSPLEGLLTGKIMPGHTFAEGDHRAKHLLPKPASSAPMLFSKRSNR